jgi:hypothetical protein
MYVLYKLGRDQFGISRGDPKKGTSKAVRGPIDGDELKWWVEHEVGRKVSPDHVIDLTGLRLVDDEWTDFFVESLPAKERGALRLASLRGATSWKTKFPSHATKMEAQRIYQEFGRGARGRSLKKLHPEASGPLRDTIAALRTYLREVQGEPTAPEGHEEAVSKALKALTGASRSLSTKELASALYLLNEAELMLYR